jgi:ATP-dependent DNA helicase PIF1
MVDGKLFDRVDRIGRAVRGNNRPFGGLQVSQTTWPPISDAHVQIIACGDFLQLPPIGEEIDNSNIKIATFAFDSEVWPQLFHRNHQYNLERNFRQEDAPFRQLLERMRRGYLDRRDHTTLRSLRRNLPQDGAIQPVFLSVLLDPPARQNR